MRWLMVGPGLMVGILSASRRYSVGSALADGWPRFNGWHIVGIPTLQRWISVGDERRRQRWQALHIIVGPTADCQRWPDKKKLWGQR